MKPTRLWAVINSQKDIVIARSLSDGEETVEIHRTRERARGAAFSDEKAVPVLIYFQHEKDIQRYERRIKVRK